MKICSKCKIAKDISCFGKNSIYEDGLHVKCKLCIKNDYQKLVKENPEKYLNKKREYRAKTIDHHNEYMKKWRNENKERLNEQKRERSKNATIHQKTAQNLRTRMRKVIKTNSKAGKTLELLGCSVEEFIIYIESKFEEGMNWNNYGVYGWHYDHIKPCASFDLSDPEQQKECFHYTNYQPLWAEDNNKKRDSLDWKR